MEITVTKDMIHQAFLNVDCKLSSGQQTKKVYSPNAKDNQYYINNIVGELGELVFAKAVVQHGYELGVDPDTFGPFMRSDVCDFYTSKTGKTIDVKTVYKDNADNLIINKQISHWRQVYNYVLVKLIIDKQDIDSPVDLYNVEKANVLGSMTFGVISKPENLRRMYGKDVYFINKKRLTPIEKMIESHFHKINEKRQRYYSEGILKLDIASVEHGAVSECQDKDEVNELAERYRSRGKESGHYNFMPIFIGASRVVSFSIHKGKLHTSLLLKALLEAEVKARTQRKTLVIPSYIENYIPKNDKEKLIEIIDNLKCNVEYVWSHNLFY